MTAYDGIIGGWVLAGVFCAAVLVGILVRRRLFTGWAAWPEPVLGVIAVLALALDSGPLLSAAMLAYVLFVASLLTSRLRAGSRSGGDAG